MMVLSVKFHPNQPSCSFVSGSRVCGYS